MNDSSYPSLRSGEGSFSPPLRSGEGQLSTACVLGLASLCKQPCFPSALMDDGPQLFHEVRPLFRCDEVHQRPWHKNILFRDAVLGFSHKHRLSDSPLGTIIPGIHSRGSVLLSLHAINNMRDLAVRSPNDEHQHGVLLSEYVDVFTTIDEYGLPQAGTSSNTVLAALLLVVGEY